MATTANDFTPKTASEFITYAKNNPGAIRYGTVGVGSFRITTWLISQNARVTLIRLPCPTKTVHPA